MFFASALRRIVSDLVLVSLASVVGQRLQAPPASPAEPSPSPAPYAGSPARASPLSATPVAMAAIQTI